MKKYQRILSIIGGISLLALLEYGTTAALLTDKEQNGFSVDVPGEIVDVVLTVDGINGESIEALSGQTFDIKPIITNEGTADVYAFLEIDVLMIGDAPVFTYTSDESAWNLVAAETADGYQKSVYSCGEMI